MRQEYAMWKEYKSIPSPELKKKLILTYTNLVHYVIHNSRLYKQGVLDSKDYFQIGVEGLSEAIDRFDPEYGTKFETYAIKRIKGKIIDAIRKVKHRPTFEDNQNSPNYYSDVSLTNTVDKDDTMLYEMLPSEEKTPEDLAEKNEEKLLLVEEIKKLKERDRLLITLYYYENLNYKEIAEVLGITVSRVSQIHSRLINKLKEKLEAVYE
jgi:RNA polymerase sigma factor for flagellar operon FliA